LTLLSISRTPGYALPQEKLQRNDYQHKLSLQINPYLDSRFASGLIAGNFEGTMWISNLRYNHTKLSYKGIDIGFEMGLVQYNSPRFEFYSINMGPGFRYGHDVLPGLRLFGEISPGLAYARYITSDHGVIPDYSKWSFNYFLAPGVTLSRPNSRWGYDIFWKFSDRYIINGRKNVISYRVSFKF
jgi:hypothetical protein